MTTIAFRDGVMAADSRYTTGGIISKGTKLFRKRVGKKTVVIGVAGSVAASRKFVDWYGTGTAMPEDLVPSDGQEFVALIWDGAKLWIVEHLGHPYEVEDEYCAIGSGASFALAAMDCGKSAREAVRIACKRDCYSGLPVITLR